MNMKDKIITECKMAQFERSLRKAEKSVNTIQKYMRDVRKLQHFANGKKLTKEVMMDYKKQLQECGNYKVSSINSFLTAANHFCNVMGWHELCVRTVKVQRTAFETEEKELTRAEYGRLVQAAEAQGDEKTALIMQTLAATGIRIGELQHITVECLEKGMLDVHNKGKVRRILLPSKLQYLLKRYVSACKIKDGAIFCQKDHRVMDRRTIWRHMKKAAQAAGVPVEKVFPHNLRHLFAREFYKQTRDIAKLADILGHSSIETTRIYIKSTGREHKEQLDRMDMIVSGDKYRIQPQCNILKASPVGSTQRKSSRILLPEDISMGEQLVTQGKNSEKMKLLENLFYIEESLKKEYEMQHNKYYVVNQNLQFVVYHSF